MLVKPRQLGFTTDYAIDMLDDACFVPGASAGIIAHDRQTLGRIFGVIKLAFDLMPPELKPVAQYDTKNEYKFTHRFDGVRLANELYVALDIRGTSVPRLHISEAAYIKDRGELKRGAKQAVPKDGRITEETTGNGLNDFYDDYMASYELKQQGKLTSMDYNTYFYPWVQNPEYSLPGTIDEEKSQLELKIIKTAKEFYNIDVNDSQLLWRRWKIKEMKSKEDGVGLNTEQQFMQEYPLTILEAFQSGAGNVFDIEKLMALMAMTPHDPLTANRNLFTNWEERAAQEQADIKAIFEKFKMFHQLGVKIWHFPQVGKKYVIGVDPSDGEGSDNTDIDVWEVPEVATDKLRQVAQFYGKIRPDHGAEVAKELAEFYNHAFVGVENNMLSFVLFFSKIYDNYYMEVDIDKKTQRRSMKLGWNTNTKTRDPMIDDFVILYEDDYLEINSATTIGEMKTFVKKENGKREHANGKHDDSLIAGMIALQMRKFEPKHGRLFYNKPSGL